MQHIMTVSMYPQLFRRDRLSLCIVIATLRRVAIAAMKRFGMPRVMKDVPDRKTAHTLQPDSRKLVVEYLLHQPFSVRGYWLALFLDNRPNWHLVWKMYLLAAGQQEELMERQLGRQSRMATMFGPSYLAIDAAGVVHDCNPEPMQQVLRLRAAAVTDVAIVAAMTRPHHRAIMDIGVAVIDIS